MIDVLIILKNWKKYILEEISLVTRPQVSFLNSYFTYVQCDYYTAVDSPHKGPVMQKMLPVDDIIMFEPLNSWLPNALYVYFALLGTTLSYKHSIFPSSAQCILGKSLYIEI